MKSRCGSIYHCKIREICLVAAFEKPPAQQVVLENPSKSFLKTDGVPTEAFKKPLYTLPSSF